MNNELKQIKKIYGEEMMHLCRELFPSLLEQEGTLIKILTDHLAPTHSFATDVKKANKCVQFKNWIYSYVDYKEEKLAYIDKTPFELMKEAGYTLYECHSEEDIQKFKHYYQKGEELCTFWGGRLNRCHVFFAVKDNADKLNRSDFKNPEREDEYGTSVISIQFSRGNNNNLSIKNRYNHTVNNPDATFSNNLENIIPGLTKSFEKKYDLNVSQDNNVGYFYYFLVDNLSYVKGDDDKYYRYNVEEEGKYYCENNIIIEADRVNDTYAKNKERYILMDCYLVDLKEKNISELNDGAPLGRRDPYFIGINVVKVIKNGKNKILYLKNHIPPTDEYTYHIDNQDDPYIKVEINENNSIIGIEDPYTTHIYANFLRVCKNVEKVVLPNVENIGRDFLHLNRNVRSLELPKVKTIGDNFLFANNNIKNIYLPNLTRIGDDFLAYSDMKSIDLPKVTNIGKSFLKSNVALASLNIPNLVDVGSSFLYHNNYLTKLDLPNLIFAGQCFLKYNRTISSVNLPNLVTASDYFLQYATDLTVLNLPKLEYLGDESLTAAERVQSLNMPNVVSIGNSFLKANTELTRVNLPKVEVIKKHFLFSNKKLCHINMPNLEYVGYSFLYNNNAITSINFPNLKTIGNVFLAKNKNISKINLPKAEQIGEEFLLECCAPIVNLPSARYIGQYFMYYDTKLVELNLPRDVEITIDRDNQNHMIWRYINEEKTNGGTKNE